MFNTVNLIYKPNALVLLRNIMSGLVCLLFISLVANSNLVKANEQAVDSANLQPSKIEFQGVEGELLNNIKIYLSVEDGRLPLSPLGFPRSIAFIQQKAQQALRSLGYYQPVIVLTGDHSQWLLTIKPGQPVVWIKSNIEINGEARALPQLIQLLKEAPFLIGKPLHHGQYTDFKNKLKSTAVDYGFFDFEFKSSQLLVDENKHQAQVKWLINSGIRYKIGQLKLQGSALSPAFLSRYISLQENQYYQNDLVIKSHQKLNRSGFFKSVLLEQNIDHQIHQVSLKFEIADLEKYQLKTKVGYGTDSGVNFGLDWQDRRATPDGHKYTIGMSSNQIKDAVFGQYRIPLETKNSEWINRLSLEQINDELARTNLTTYESSLLYQLDDHWSSQWSLTLATEEVRENENIESQLEYLIPSFNLDYSSVVDPFSAQNGWRWQQRIRFANKALTDPDFDFVQMEQQVKSIWSLSENWRLITKGRVGYTRMDDDSFNQFMPTQYRFFAGGDASVRGYKLQALSPSDDEGLALGGKHLLSYTIETDYRFADDFRWALFFDSGNSFNSWKKVELRDSVGVGLRWVTPVGSIRLDYARALDEQENWRWHLTIGPDL